jgi:hypothetical protein
MYSFPHFAPAGKSGNETIEIIASKFFQPALLWKVFNKCVVCQKKEGEEFYIFV